MIEPNDTKLSLNKMNPSAQPDKTICKEKKFQIFLPEPSDNISSWVVLSVHVTSFVSHVT